MWHTPLGERVLHGSERLLFRLGLRALRGQIEEAADAPDLCETGVAVFDRLQPASKLAMIATVGKALTDDDEPCPPLTGLTEGTFAAIYAAIRQEIAVEIDLGREGRQSEGEEFSMRPFVLAAVRETGAAWDDHPSDTESEDQDLEPPALPQPDREDVGAWDDLLEELMDRVLWGDRDFEEEEFFLDKDPRESRLMKRLMGIDGDYFSAVAPEPTEDQLTTIRETFAANLRPPRSPRLKGPEGRGDRLNVPRKSTSAATRALHPLIGSSRIPGSVDYPQP
jgi:hypothetical protein